MAGLYHLLEIECDRERLFDTFKNIEGVKTWWTSEGEIISNEPEVYHFNFPSGAQNKMQVLEKIKGKSVHWKCLDGHKEWIGTEITFVITKNSQGHCNLHFKHFSWEKESPFLGQCNHFWGFYLDRMKKVCESSKEK